MKLVKLKLRNFRCYQQESTFLVDDLTAIIGKNDIGKSTLIEALDGFFNDKVDSNDLSTNTDGNTIEITCFFEGIPEEVILDTSVPSSPIDEGILNAENQLEIKKVFTFAGRKSVAYFLIANYPIDERLRSLLSKKNTLLKNYAAELGVDLSDINRTKNPPIRKRIRDHIGGERAICEIKVDGNIDTEDNIRTIWGAIKKMLPIFSLFKVDKALDDKDDDIKDPMQVAINEALALPEIQSLLEQVELKVKEASTDVADRTIEKLKDFDESLSERLKSEFSKTPSYSKIFDLTLLNENNIPLNKRGSGIRRLVLLSFFQAQEEMRKTESNAPSIIYAIEEPETSQHPNHQKLIIDALINLSNQNNVQVLFTTHSANLVREIPIKSLRYISLDENGLLKIEYGKDLAVDSDNEEVIQKIIKTLGILPNPSDRVKVLLYVEGNHDVNALKRYSHIIHCFDPNIIDLSVSKSVGYVITGGSALKHYIEQKHLEGLGKPEVHIYDNDVEDYRHAVNTINGERNPNKIAFNTSKLELENFLHHEAIQNAYADNGINNIIIDQIEDTQDVPLIVAEKLFTRNGNDWGAIDEEKRKELSGEKKKILNTQAVDKMTIDMIRERNGYNEMVLWFSTIRDFIN